MKVTPKSVKTLEEMDFGEKMVEGFREAAAYAAGEPNECEVEEYEPRVHALTSEYIQEIRRKVARSTKKFEALFGVKARTMEVYERGGRKPDAAMAFLLRSIEADPEAALRLVSKL
ncbi:MAG TPA: hypothetical protein VGZ00_09595 [Candidatus Baltobacteraceae bacterium]|jgi:putative transcriptional regulator|nr:hypothetical protein [Candidatus Baltobacteraceae bacterium]